jgi:hypothetical protein
MFKKTALTVIGAGGIAAGFLTFGPSGTAHADCTILVPGHQDDNGSGYVAQLAATNQLPSCYVVAEYPADIGPLPSQSGNPPLSMDDATNVGADRTDQIYQDMRANGENGQITVRTYSEGGAVGLKWANRHICGDQNGCGQLVPLPPGVNLEQDGDPYGSTGALSASPWIQNGLVKPFVNLFGVPTDLQTPANTQRNFSQNDLVANLGPQQLSVVAPFSMMATFSAHGVQDFGRPHVQWVGPNGEINNEWDVGINPVSVATIQNGGQCDSVCNDANNAWNPIANGFDPGAVQIPQVSPGDVPAPLFAPPNFAPPPDFVAPVPLAQVPAPVAPVVQQSGTVHSDTPSFFGEAQCPGGGYTPGDAPC